MCFGDLFQPSSDIVGYLYGTPRPLPDSTFLPAEDASKLSLAPADRIQAFAETGRIHAYSSGG